MPSWLRILAHIAPQVLLFTPLAPIAAAVAAAIAEAEAIAGATGPEKLAHVVNIAVDAANAANAQAGHAVIDPTNVKAVAQEVVSVVVRVSNLVHTTAVSTGAEEDR